MSKAKPKIWKEWNLIRHSKDYDNNYSYYWRPLEFKTKWYVWASVSTKNDEGNNYIMSNIFDWIKPFKTKEAAMLKAQSLILKEYREIQQVMRDKV